MKLTIERAALADLMSRGGKLSPRVNTIPILGHVRLIAKSDTLEASTNDLDMQAEASVAATVTVPGATTVNSKALADFVSKLPPKATAITMEVDATGGFLTAKAGRNKARLPTLPVGDFPDLKTVGNGRIARFEITGSDIMRLLARTIVAASTEETRYYLCGAFIHYAAGQLCAVTTNGHILLRTGIPAPAGADALPTGRGSHPGVIVPTATVNEAIRLFQREASVRLVVSESGIEFSAGSTRLASKLIDGTFPDCDRVIPQAGKHRVNLDKGSCLAALNLVEVFQSKDSGRAIECGADEDGLAMAAGGSEGEGDGFAVAQADFEGTFPTFGVSSVYLRTVLNSFAADLVSLAISSPGDPIRVECAADSDSIGVIMPMRINRSRLSGMGAVQ